MSDPETMKNILEAFAQYGFRKTSMEDLARASALSRQTLYKRFGSKEAIYHWALRSFCKSMLDQTLGELENSNQPPKQCLVAALDRWGGDHIGLVAHSAHGGELLEMAGGIFAGSPDDPVTQLEDALASFLMDQKLASHRQKARDAAYTMIISAKGLLLKAQSSEEYRAGTSRVVEALF
jgi:AcrR family transcriptional regulator